MICYLCGLSIEGAASRDHVPPQQLWSPEIRRRFNVDRLITLPTHLECNTAFKRDEEYAVRVLSTLAYDSPTGRSVAQHGFAKVRSGKGVGLHRGILESMSARPSGLYLPHDRVSFRVEGARLTRVLWKIVRGLWYLEYGLALAEDTPHAFHIQEPENKDTPKFEEFWYKVRAQSSRGLYQAVFAHKYLRYEEDGDILHGWAMLFWDRVIAYTVHFDPDNPPHMDTPAPRGSA